MTDFEEITGYFQSFDEKELFYRKWVPKDNPKKIVFIGYHGGAVNSKNMKHPGEHFSKKGYPFYALDQRGHGNCDKKDMGYVKNYHYYIKDIVSFVEFVKKKEKSDKIVLVGHSNGGGLVVATAIKHKNVADYLILSAPTIRLYGNKFGLFIQEILAYSLGTILPRMKIAHGIKPEELCRDQEVLKERSADPYYWEKGTLRWVRTIFRFSRFNRKNFSKLEIPALFMVPEDDKIVDPETTLKLFPKIKDKPGMQLNYYKGHLHELFNEDLDKRNKIFKDIEEYLKI
ncbi:MAG TPA: alpha/beta fold hydrolase [Candidatus Glassbacteria bacterium]|nr:alpha/beta fold hydrolase [Candidatus Glassbacteria bacterium]